ncbi:hypothetical protein KHA80_03515 [Anaerobacillus sp. HL2]|nr:hypothetical protein KHA80_03515 [Anaerobacillus sp. HL2]
MGGGSTEVTLFRNRKLMNYHSFPFGAITLQQKFIKSEIPTDDELKKFKNVLNDQFQSIGLDQSVIFAAKLAKVAVLETSLLIHRKTNYPLSGLHQYKMNF